MIVRLGEALAFPPVQTALPDPNGLLCVGGDLRPERLLLAYRSGIFPWFSPGDPILWWSPDPRMVLVPAALHVPRSLAKVIRLRRYEVRFDTAFADVILGCASAPRAGQHGTWITRDIAAGYIALHQLGFAHSAECWIDDELVGGLYGVAIGRMFYGESMFACVADASKIAFVHLVRWLQQQQFGLIDCQMRTEHLARFGAHEIPRSVFLQQLGTLCAQDGPTGIWHYAASGEPV